MKNKKAKRPKKDSYIAKLLPCAFCGAECKAPRNLITHVGLSYTKYYIECDRCACRGPQSLDKKIALKAWNKRK